MQKIRLEVWLYSAKSGEKIREIVQRVAGKDFFTEEYEITNEGIGNVIGFEWQPFGGKDYLVLVVKPEGEVKVFYDNKTYVKAELIGWIPSEGTRKEYLEVLNSSPALDLLEECNKLKEALQREFAKETPF